MAQGVRCQCETRWGRGAAAAPASRWRAVGGAGTSERHCASRVCTQRGSEDAARGVTGGASVGLSVGAGAAVGHGREGLSTRVLNTRTHKLQPRNAT